MVIVLMCEAICKLTHLPLSTATPTVLLGVAMLATKLHWRAWGSHLVKNNVNNFWILHIIRHDSFGLVKMLQKVMKYAALVEIVFSLHISAAVSLSINSAPVPADSPLKLLSESFYLNYFHLKTLSLLNCHVVSEANISQLLKIKPSAWWDTIRGIFV